MSSKPADEVVTRAARERLEIAFRQARRLLPVLLAAAGSALWIWHSSASDAGMHAYGWMSACLLQTCFVWVVARRYLALTAEGRETRCSEFRRYNTLAGLLHGLLCSTFIWTVLPALPQAARVSASVALMVLAGWLASAGTLLRVGFACSALLPALSLIGVWWPAAPGRFPVEALLVALLGAALLWMHREQELLLQRSVLLNARNNLLMREALQRSQLIESINKRKTEIIAAASHDLRQPVHALGLLVQRLRPQMPEADQLVLFHMVRSRVSVISEMLSGLLDLSKLDSGSYQVKLERTRLRDIVEEVLGLFEEKAHRKGLTLSHSVADVDVQTDASLLKQIIYNLVSNAVKYTRQGGVAVRAGPGRRRYFSIEVQDTGTGIPPSNLEEIFMEYYRLPPHRNGNEDGLGIGLTLVKRAASLLGYRIHVRSKLDVGSRFIVDIPSQRISPHVVYDLPAADTVPGDVDGNAGYSILILENDEIANQAMVHLVTDWGYRVVTGLSGQHLLSRLRENPAIRPDLIVSDMHLGEGLDGLDYIEAFRELFKAPDLPGVVVTGDLSRELQARATQARVRMLYKPLQPRLLKAALRAALLGRPVSRAG